jgi:hypothetical protein
MAVLVQEKDLGLVVEITSSDSYLPITGYYHPDSKNGWLWDRRVVEDSSSFYSSYVGRAGGHSAGLKDGIKKDWWQSGVVQDCDYKGVSSFSVLDHHTWTPYVGNGQYSLNYDARNLFGDWSYTGKFVSDILNVDGFMFKELRSDCLFDSIQIAMWKRDSEYKIYKYMDFKFVEEFTEVFSGGVRLETGDPANVTDRKYEYIIDINDNAVLNGNHVKVIGVELLTDYVEPPIDDMGTLLEAQGSTSVAGRDVFLTYLPVQIGSVKVWVKNVATETQMVEVDDLTVADPSAIAFEVDYDLGIVTLGGYQAPDLILSTAIDEVDTEVLVYSDEIAIGSYPSTGVITIGTEEIYYAEKNSYGFSNCTRAFNGTAAAIHVQGDTISHRRMGTSPLGLVYVEYTAVPRIDYEVVPGDRSCNKYPWVDLRPFSNVKTNGILQIYPGDIYLDHITLATSSPLIGSNLYGPLYYGIDASLLTATAYDAKENSVEEIPLTIVIDSGEGLLNGVSSSFTDYTNSEGQIYAYYNHPLDQDTLENRVVAVTYDAGDTIFTLEREPENVSVSDVWIMQIRKHDKYVGTVGLPLVVTAERVVAEPYGVYQLDLDGIISDDFLGGLVKIVISGITYYRTITFIDRDFDVDDIAFSRICLDGALASAVGDTAYLLEPDAVLWDSSLLNGTRYIVYEYSSTTVHPVSGLLGAFTPLQPDSISGSDLRFVGLTLPAPNASDDTVNLGSYVAITPGTTYLYAYGVDPISGRYIQSNTIRLKTILSPTVVGVDYSGASPVPTGIKLPVEEFNVSAGLGGANFLTINPITGSINTFVLSLEI